MKKWLIKKVFNPILERTLGVDSLGPATTLGLLKKYTQPWTIKRAFLWCYYQLIKVNP